MSQSPPPPADVTGQLAEQLLLLTRRIHHAQKHHFKPLGITPAQSRLLRTLERHEEPPRMADVAERLGVVPRAVTTHVDALEEHGLVRRVPDPANRRVTRIETTEAGRAALAELHRARLAAAADVLKPLSEQQREKLLGLIAPLVGPPGRPC